MKVPKQQNSVYGTQQQKMIYELPPDMKKSSKIREFRKHKECR